MDKNKPYVSIIINFRNDDYQSGGFVRMQTAISNLVDQARRYRLRAELIVVDWNPPESKMLLKDAMVLPKDLGPLVVRFIVVPLSIHQKHKAAKRINIIIPAAWNVGIRRARGEFILPTNSDILFSDQMIHFLSLENLDKKYSYRAFKYEVSRDESTWPKVSDQILFWQKNIKQADLENRVSPHGLKNHPVLLTMCGADFLVVAKENWFLMRGYPELNPLSIGADELACYMAYLSGLTEKVLEDPMRIYHIDHNSRWRHLRQNRFERFLRSSFFNKLDINNKIRATARKMYRVKHDIAMILFSFYYNLFDALIKKYASPESLNFNQRYLGWHYKKVLLQMLKGKRPYWYNDNNWGFPNEHFEEFIVSSKTYEDKK